MSGIELVWERAARHRCTLVRDAHGTAWFVKRKGVAEDVSGPSLAQEIGFYADFLQGNAGRHLGHFVPRYVGHADHRALVVEGYCERRALSDALLAEEVDSSVFTEIGGFLASLHRIPCQDSLAADGLKRIPSPVLTHGHVTPTHLVNRPSAYAELLRLLQSVPALNDHFRKLRGVWSQTWLIHGDFKVDNILIGESKAVHAAGFRVVDWEAVGIGDRDWDCAALIGSLYYLWVVHCFASDGPGGLSARDVTRHVEAFLAGYEERSSAPLDHSRILAWAGYWIAHKVIGRLMPNSPLSAHDLAAMHLAQQLLASEPLPDQPSAPAAMVSGQR